MANIRRNSCALLSSVHDLNSYIGGDRVRSCTESLNNTLPFLLESDIIKIKIISDM